MIWPRLSRTLMATYHSSWSASARILCGKRANDRTVFFRVFLVILIDRGLFPHDDMRARRDIEQHHKPPPFWARSHGYKRGCTEQRRIASAKPCPALLLRVPWLPAPRQLARFVPGDKRINIGGKEGRRCAVIYIPTRFMGNNDLRVIEKQETPSSSVENRASDKRCSERDYSMDLQ